MNAELSAAYRLGQQIEHTEADLREAEKAVTYTRFGLKLMFVTTLLQYFIFCMGFYVADVFGLTTWLTLHTAEWFAFSLFLVMAVLMSLSLAMGKHIFYEHRAVIKSALLPVLIMAALGVFFELFNSSSQQQNIAYDHAENSKAFASVAGTSVNVGSTSDSGTLAYYQGELAKAKQYLATCKKTCTVQRGKVAEYSAKVESLLASQQTAAANVATATASAIKAKADTLQNLKDEAHKPVFKFARDLLGITIAAAVVVVAGLVSMGFEYGHAYMSKVLGEKLAYLAALREQLAKLQGGYLGQTGKTHAAGGEVDLNGAMPAPAFVPFKWQQRAKQAGEAIGREMLKAQAARNALHSRIHGKADPLAASASDMIFPSRQHRLILPPPTAKSCAKAPPSSVMWLLMHLPYSYL